jgi:hypothetical protein
MRIGAIVYFLYTLPEISLRIGYGYGLVGDFLNLLLCVVETVYVNV